MILKRIVHVRQKSIKELYSIMYGILSDKLGRVSRRLIVNRIDRNRLSNEKFSIISQNCIGSVIYHDLGHQFLSPTINMRFDPNEFVRFLENIEYYLVGEIKFIKSDYPYPVGMISDITIHFVHYHTEEEVIKKWKERTGRINWNNIFVICSDENMNYENIAKFDSLNKFPNKILFTNKHYPEFKSTLYFPEYKNKKQIDLLLNFANPLGKRKYQRHFDYVQWLNKKV
jgi:uncharacterized protein (DUF1919 family)